MIDLHCHSIYSDGALSPQELINKALANDLRCVSITDHDTMAAYPELEAAVKSTSLTLIKGIELSTRWKKHELHVLGYQINDMDVMNQLIAIQAQCRIERAQHIGNALQGIGVHNAYDKACYIAGHTRAARPHFAQVLVNEGLAKNMQAAFKQFLARGRVAFISTQWVSLNDAVEQIAASGGQAVIAHPLKYGLTRSKLHELIKVFKEAGGVGIEVVSGLTTSSEIEELMGMSIRFELLASTGSDFHADKISRVDLGRQYHLPAKCTPIWHKWNIE